MMLQTKAGHKLTEMHLERAAVVYLRQSTEKQLRHNGESRRLQYALKDRARELPDGPRTYIHCGAGIGRTGTFAGAVLCRIGYAPENTCAEIRAAATFPVTEQQRALAKLSNRSM